MGLSPEVIDGLLNEESILERVKVQDLLAVASGARPASVVTVPAELPEAAQLGREIDRQFYAHMEGRDHDPYDPIARLVGRAVDRVRKKVLTEIKYKTEALNNIVVENLKDAAGYRALKKFVEELGLRVEVEISRPTIQEMYLMTSADLALDVRELGRLRRDLRHMALRNPVPHGPVHRRLFPEESSLEFTRAAGRLLGYPACCIERYGFDQASVTLPAEERASGQITRGRAAGEEPDPFAYFTRDFFPCDPRCPEASAMGHRVHHALKELSNRAAEFYRRQLHENVELVVRYPEIIQEHIARLQEHARAAGGGKVGPAG